MRLAAGIALAACTSAPPKTPPLQTRLAEQNALFEQVYQADLKAHPERATAYGDYRYNDRLDDRSLAALAAEHASDEAYLARLRAVPSADFPEPDRLSHEVLERTLQQRIDNYALKEYEMPVSQMDGPHVHLADLPLAVPFDSVKDYDDYLARLHQIPRVFAETREVLQAGMKDGLMPVRFLLEKVPAQCDGVIKADPFLLPLGKFPAAIVQEERDRLSRAIRDAVADEVLPAYAAFAAYIATDYAPRGRTTLAVTSLPGGAARYLNAIKSRTTVSTLTPEEIHRIGLSEIERIETDMRAIALREGFADLASFRESLKTNPKYRPVSAQQIVADFQRYVAQMEPK